MVFRIHIVALVALIACIASVTAHPKPQNGQPKPGLPGVARVSLPDLASLRQGSETGVSVRAAGLQSSASVYGGETHVITDAEITSFGLGDENLKQGVEAARGARPSDAYLRSSTPWGDLYTVYSWSQVQTTVRPIYAEVLEPEVVPTLVSSVPFNNTSSQPATFDVSAMQQVRNTVGSSWTASGSVSFSQTIKYNVEFLGTGGGGETAFGFEAGWGIGGEQAQTIVVGLSSGASVDLDPGESVVATIRASRGTMKVRVRYLATLSGSVACNYSGKFDGHHFWAFDVNEVMRAQGLATQQEIEEILEIDYYFDSYVEVSDVRRVV